MNRVKPILFNTEMVRAILDGRKTATRRIVKDVPIAIVNRAYRKPGTGDWAFYSESGIVRDIKQRYQIGDILYVRETWNYGYFDSSDEELCNAAWFEAMPIDYDGVIINCHYVYRADYTEKEQSEMGVEHDDGSYRMDWRPSIHMPKEAARIFLRVTNVRVERLQEITEDGVCEEGAGKLISCPNERTIYYPEGGMEACFNTDVCSKCDYIDKSYPELFGEIVWNRTIKPADREKYGWGANPWVWVIEFERINREDI